MKNVDPIRDIEKIQLMKNILRKKSYRDYFLFSMGINVGLRVSDLLQLKVKDVKAKREIHVKEKKVGKWKDIQLNKTMQQEIKEYIVGMDDEDFLFASMRDKTKPIDRVRAYRILNEAAEEAGVDGRVGTHTMRKTFGYWHYKQHKDTNLLQYIFNHSSPSITKRYIGVYKDKIRESLEDFYL